MTEDRKRLWTVVAISMVITTSFYAYETWQKSRAPKAKEPATAQVADNGAKTTAAPKQDTKRADSAGNAPSQPSPAAKPLTEAERAAREKLFTIKSDTFVATVSNLTGGVRDFKLTDKRYNDKGGAPKDMATANKALFPDLRAEVRGLDMPNDLIWDATQLPDGAVRMVANVNGFRVVRKLEAGNGPYQLWSTDRVENHSGATHPVALSLFADHYVLRKNEGGGFFGSRSPEISHSICIAGEKTDRLVRGDDKLGFERRGFGPAVELAGVENNFFAVAMAPANGRAERCVLSWMNSVATYEKWGFLGPKRVAEGTLFRAELKYPRTELKPEASVTYRTLAYLGPKDRKALLTAGHGMPKVIDLGWFSIVAEYLVLMLSFVYGYTGNWGVAIILMTVFFKLIFFPLTWKSFQSMGKMRVLKPEMDRINELYKDDSQKKGAAVMELYRKHGVNPVGGCIPQLLQMPVWIAFYASLSTNTALYRAHFALHWTDLSAPDPYYILPLLLGGLMFLQQRLTPTTMDPAQAKMMLYFMPIMMTSVFFFLPSGLCLYSVTNSVLTFGQQHLIFKRLDDAAAAGAQGGDSNLSLTGGPSDESQADSESNSKTYRGTFRRKAKRG